MIYPVELTNALKVSLANSFVLQLKAHYYHWNVEGPNFAQFHELFGKIYQEIDDSIDALAEELRGLDVYTPGSLTRFSELSQIKDELMIPPPLIMASRLLADIELATESFKDLFDLSEKSRTYGLSNLIADRIDALTKHAWMLRATVKDFSVATNPA